MINTILTEPTVTSGKHTVKVESPAFRKPFELTHPEALQAADYLRNLAGRLEDAARGRGA